MDQLKRDRDHWEAEIEKKGVKERKNTFLTRSKIPVEMVYTPIDLKEAGFDYVKDINLPGAYPYTRGIEPLMYRENLWLIGQYGGFGSPEETNKRFKYLLSQGITALTIALDLPTAVLDARDLDPNDDQVAEIAVLSDELKAVMQVQNNRAKGAVAFWSLAADRRLGR